MLIRNCPTRVLLRRVERGELTPDFAVIVSHSMPLGKRDGELLASIPHVLSLEYDDVTDPQAFRPFTFDHARRIVEFYRALPAETCLYVTCDYGESRSAAIAAALRRYEGGDEMRIWRDPGNHPNLLVYRLLCESLGLSCGRFLLWQRRRASRTAYRQELRRRSR